MSDHETYSYRTVSPVEMCECGIKCVSFFINETISLCLWKVMQQRLVTTTREEPQDLRLAQLFHPDATKRRGQIVAPVNVHPGTLLYTSFSTPKPPSGSCSFKFFCRCLKHYCSVVIHLHSPIASVLFFLSLILNPLFFIFPFIILS